MTRYEFFAIRHKGMLDNAEGEAVFNFLAKDSSVNAMIVFSELNMPALSGVVKELEKQFEGNTDFRIDNPRNRRFIGRMVNEILKDFGYTPIKGRKRVRKFAGSKYFTTASVYALDGDITPKYRITVVDKKN